MTFLEEFKAMVTGQVAILKKANDEIIDNARAWHRHHCSNKDHSVCETKFLKTFDVVMEAQCNGIGTLYIEPKEAVPLKEENADARTGLYL